MNQPHSFSHPNPRVKASAQEAIIIFVIVLPLFISCSIKVLALVIQFLAVYCLAVPREVKRLLIVTNFPILLIGNYELGVEKRFNLEVSIAAEVISLS